MRKIIVVAALTAFAFQAQAQQQSVIPYNSNQYPGDVLQPGDTSGIPFFREWYDFQDIQINNAAATFASGNSIGGLLSVQVPQSYGKIYGSVSINAGASAGCPCDLLLFNANPSGSTFNNGAAATIVAADFAKLIGRLNLSDCVTSGTTICEENVSLSLSHYIAGGAQPTGPFTLYAALVSRQAGAVPANGFNLHLRFGR